MIRVFIIHGWGGNPNKEWFPWAEKEISNSGYEVIVPEMPETDNPKINLWVKKLREIVGELKPTDIFIGHSIGCQTILRYLDECNLDFNINKVILVAPWWYLTLETKDEKIIAEPWLKIDIDFEKIKSKIDNLICIFSDNDPVVPLEINTDFFKQKLNPKIIVENKKGHFSGEDGIFEIPVLLEQLKDDKNT